MGEQHRPRTARTIPITSAHRTAARRPKAQRSCSGPNRDARYTIEAHHRAASVDNYGYSDDRDHQDMHHLRRQDDRRRGGRYDSDVDRDHSWSPDQRGPRAFGLKVRDAKSPRTSEL
jgi:hypothetical protein